MLSERLDAFVERLDAIEGKIDTMLERQTDSVTRGAVVDERLAQHILRSDIHTIPPCEASKRAWQDLREEISAQRRWVIGMLATSVLALLGGAWAIVWEHIKKGGP